MFSCLGFEELRHEELLEYFGVCCIPFVVALEKVVVEGKSRSCKDGCPHWHVGHRIFVEKSESLPIDINNRKVEEDFSFFEKVISSKSDAGTNPRRFKFMNNVLFKFVSRKKSMDHVLL